MVGTRLLAHEIKTKSGSRKLFELKWVQVTRCLSRHGDRHQDVKMQGFRGKQKIQWHIQIKNCQWQHESESIPGVHYIYFYTKLNYGHWQSHSKNKSIVFIVGSYAMPSISLDKEPSVASIIHKNISEYLEENYQEKTLQLARTPALCTP